MRRDDVMMTGQRIAAVEGIRNRILAKRQEAPSSNTSFSASVISNNEMIGIGIVGAVVVLLHISAFS